MASGPWQERVDFTPGGYLAFRPGELLVRSAVAAIAADHLTGSYGDAVRAETLLEDRWTKFIGVPDPMRALGELRGLGIFAQPNHVLFANCCCPPHPSRSAEGGVGANPFLASSLTANPFLASPVLANPFLASPFLASPFLASPFLASAAGCGCCHCAGGGAIAANPFLASAGPSPAAAPWFSASGRRRSTARPTGPPQEHDVPRGDGVRVAILDTGLAAVNPPAGVAANNVNGVGGDEPDEDGDGYLDPVAGHGTFIAGVIEQLAPGCQLDVYEVLTTYGDGGEAEIADLLTRLAAGDELPQPDIVNLSFGSYSPIGMEVLADAIAALHTAGVIVVASAGNDATCVPTYPAALPGVVSVGALDDDGSPAAYTNYGPWVRACTVGTDVVSWFFDGFNGAEPPDVKGVDDDDFRGWAQWSGTSFAAPRVAAAFARELSKGTSPQDVLEQLLGPEQPPRRSLLGNVILP